MFPSSWRGWWGADERSASVLGIVLLLGVHIAVADFSGSRRLGKLPGTLADWILESSGAASCPLMAGSPVMSLPKGEGVSGGLL